MAGLHFRERKMYMNKILVLLAAVLLSFQTHAALVSHAGADIIPAFVVQEDSPINTHQQGFNEKHLFI